MQNANLVLMMNAFVMATDVPREINYHVLFKSIDFTCKTPWALNCSLCAEVTAGTNGFLQSSHSSVH